jgi:hypothetical protein
MEPNAPRRRLLLERTAVLILGLYLLGTGVSKLRNGRWLYPNYLGRQALAPAAIVVGLLLILLGLFRWSDAMQRGR